MQKICFISMGLGSKEVWGIQRNTIELLRAIDSFENAGGGGGGTPHSFLRRRCISL